MCELREQEPNGNHEKTFDYSKLVKGLGDSKTKAYSNTGGKKTSRFA